MAELETLIGTARIRAALEDWEPGENVDTDAILKDALIISLDLLDALREAIYEEWGHNWQTQPACRRVLGERMFVIMQERDQEAIETMTAYRQQQQDEQRRG